MFKLICRKKDKRVKQYQTFFSEGPIKIIYLPEVQYSDYTGEAAKIEVKAEPHSLELFDNDEEIEITWEEQ